MLIIGDRSSPSNRSISGWPIAQPPVMVPPSAGYEQRTFVLSGARIMPWSPKVFRCAQFMIDVLHQVPKLMAGHASPGLHGLHGSGVLLLPGMLGTIDSVSSKQWTVKPTSARCFFGCPLKNASLKRSSDAHFEIFADPVALSAPDKSLAGGAFFSGPNTADAACFPSLSLSRTARASSTTSGDAMSAFAWMASMRPSSVAASIALRSAASAALAGVVGASAFLTTAFPSLSSSRAARALSRTPGDAVSAFAWMASMSSSSSPVCMALCSAASAVIAGEAESVGVFASRISSLSLARRARASSSTSSDARSALA
eukprot:scaffold22688_cov55-Phaeocystis_antarctica.AAC.6